MSCLRFDDRDDEGGDTAAGGFPLGTFGRQNAKRKATEKTADGYETTHGGALSQQ